MVEGLLELFRRTLPDELSSLLSERIADVENGNFGSLLESPFAREILGHENGPSLEDVRLQDFETWNDYVFHRLGILLGKRKESTGDEKYALEDSPQYKQHLVFLIGYAALLAFLQSNVTGPPLPFSTAKTIFPSEVSKDKQRLATARQGLVNSLSVDAIAAYKLTPNVELLCLADAIMTCPPIIKNIPAVRWAKMRVQFIHQRLLSEPSPTVQQRIYEDLEALEDQYFDSSMAAKAGLSTETKVQFLLERASIETFHGFDKRARADLELAAKEQNFQFALTGLLGRRTKWQQHDVISAQNNSRNETDSEAKNGTSTGPQNLDLNDDTLLESISFTEKPKSFTDVQDASNLPSALADVDPSNQPLLQPLDSVILLSLASSITNTSPQNGLTREETLPYATRVLEGGSSNWQVYTQALLVRSRIEGYKSRTVERGLLQLQAVVDQVVADTLLSENGTTATEGASTTFLPRPKESESAGVTERLKYVFQLASPSRWELEAELASRWVQMGGLRSALEIYERLEMWAEAALCWAATEKEEKAKRMDTAMWEKAWQVSNQRYARAQRSLGRFYFAAHDYVKAAGAYSKSLNVNQLNHPSWFALGCALLELGQFSRAAESFQRCVSLDEQDAEAWSNLAAALLKFEPDQAAASNGAKTVLDDEDESVAASDRKADSQKNRRDALRALKRAATLKYDSYRIWENMLIVAASLSPPDYTSVLSAQKHIIELRGPTVGEKCVDVEIMSLMVRHVIASSNAYDPSKPGLERMIVETFDKQIVPLITANRQLWQLVAKLALWRNRPSSALEAHEKAWRAVTTQPGWETESERRWNDVVDATIELCDAYESLGPREKNEGLGAGEGALVAKDWKFKARSAVRGIMGRGKGSWEDTEGWDRLKDAMENLRN
ncbi:hypothetical protein H2203_008579 [Taxawa tesnikishii (nom. ined.)]|nr:hypothetical protein H2203_008579 [Dothideales sp. JES 119]